jgi:hypothetical protein
VKLNSVDAEATGTMTVKPTPTTQTILGQGIFNRRVTQYLKILT